jgi:hypothetical protein
LYFRPTYDNIDDGGTGDDVDMNAFRDVIATAMVSSFSSIHHLFTRSLEICAGTSFGIFVILIYWSY